MSADQSLTQRQRRRLLIRVMLRVLATITVVVALYYIFPLDRLDGIPVFLPLAAALLLLIVAGVLEMRAVVRPRTPRSEPSNRCRIHPIFLVLFASAYYVMARANPDNFSIHTLTRTDTLYFAMTVFSTVGFGDIAPTSQVARILVTVQMALNLILLGLGVRLLTQAVHMGVGRRQAESRPADPTTPGI